MVSSQFNPLHLRHTSRVNLTFDAPFEEKKHQLRLLLEPNRHIIHPSAVLTFLDAQGNVKREEHLSAEDHRVYHGSTWLRDGQWGEKMDGAWRWVGDARVVLIEQGTQPLFEGTFEIENNYHHVKLQRHYQAHRSRGDYDGTHFKASQMVVYRDFESVETTPRNVTAADVTDLLTSPFNPEVHNNNLHKRQCGSSGCRNAVTSTSLIQTIGNNGGCPIERKVALVGVAVDCNYMAAFPNVDAVRQNIIQQVNTASGVYENSFNIAIGLKQIILSDANCPQQQSTTAPWNVQCSNLSSINDQLNSVSKWRGTMTNDSIASWSLWTGCRFGASAGVAWVGSLCMDKTITQGDGTALAGTNVVTKGTTEWKTFAHEFGHNFGAVHDCDSSLCSTQSTPNTESCCPLSGSTCDTNGRYLMYPSESSSVNGSFSPCTIGNICSSIGTKNVNTQCLTSNKDVQLADEAECGNGIVEAGEDCDCGGPSGCAGNACCDPNTCKFVSGAVCDDATAACCKSCQFAAPNVICQPSTEPICSPSLFCTGNSSRCPDQSTSATDGTACGNSSNSGLACASGMCTSRNDQCFRFNSNSTGACAPDSVCQVACQIGATCYLTSQSFVDGTPCAGNGQCSAGVCQNGGFWGSVGSWISNNKSLVIGLAAGIGGALMLLIAFCVGRSCWRKRHQPASAKQNLTPSPPSSQYVTSPMRSYNPTHQYSNYYMPTQTAQYQQYPQYQAPSRY